MPELGPYGSVRGARGNSRPYRESRTASEAGPFLPQQRTCRDCIGMSVSPNSDIAGIAQTGLSLFCRLTCPTPLAP